MNASLSVPLISVTCFARRGQAKVVIEPAQHSVKFPQFYPLEDPDDILAREELEDDTRYSLIDCVPFPYDDISAAMLTFTNLKCCKRRLYASPCKMPHAVVTRMYVLSIA